MNQPAISIIISIFNSEKYLKKCLDSLINQTLKEIEIICINDGSKDSSVQIVEEYISKDDRIKLFNKENLGISETLNFGIEQATGEYFTIVNPCDWLKKDACEVLYKTIKERDSKILLFSHLKCSNGSATKYRKLEKLKEIAKNENINFSTHYEELIKGPMFSFGKLFKSEFIHDNNIFFPSNIQYAGNIIFSLKAYIDADKISILDETLYNCRINEIQNTIKNDINCAEHTFKVYKLLKQFIYSSNKIKNKSEVYQLILFKITNILILRYKSNQNKDLIKENIKYIRRIKKEFKPYSKKNEDCIRTFRRINELIKKYNYLFIKKLIEPIIEIENRTDRSAIYLFEKQVLNCNTEYIKNKLLRLKYFFHILRLRQISKKRKLKVAFWCCEPEKWTSIESLYRELEKSPNFEPVVYLSCPKIPFVHINQEKLMEENVELLESRNINYIKIYSPEEDDFIPIEEKKCDIIFYQQPWEISEKQSVLESSNFALTCYIPYGFDTTKSKTNYLRYFHKKLWKHFVETEYHKKEYEKEYGANNCHVSGSAKFDNYKTIQVQKSDKKTIMYAPHHSFAQNSIFRTSTFLKNKDFILELAKKHPETNWIFRPHFALKDRLLKFGAMTQEEISNYWAEWEKIATISKDTDNYYKDFMLSDCLITDCLSFLGEYAPSGNPVLHLRRDEQRLPFNDIIKKITDSYYKIHTNEELEKTFEEVILKGNDYLEKERKENIKYLIIDENKTAAQRIIDYIKEELRIN